MRRWSCCCHVCTGPKLTFNCSLSRLEILTLAMCPESGAAPGVPGPCRPGAGQGWVTPPVVTGPVLSTAARRRPQRARQRKRPSRGSHLTTGRLSRPEGLVISSPEDQGRAKVSLWPAPHIWHHHTSLGWFVHKFGHRLTLSRAGPSTLIIDQTIIDSVIIAIITLDNTWLLEFQIKRIFLFIFFWKSIISAACRLYLVTRAVLSCRLVGTLGRAGSAFLVT